MHQLVRAPLTAGNLIVVFGLITIEALVDSSVWVVKSSEEKIEGGGSCAPRWELTC